MIKGYKVFNPDWTCRGKQYSCPGKFEEDVDPEICRKGIHFCKKINNCFNYYDFDPDNHVAEVVAYGEVKDDDDKCVTDKLEIIREISWHEVLDLVNIGENCTGRGNVGIYNTGNWNVGNGNTGNYNGGDRNSGHYNSGNYNKGNSNSGTYNTGNWNTGKSNIGHYNCGNWNTGSWNTGNWNTGHYNCGDWNLSSYNSGCFNSKRSAIIMFNRPSDWIASDWYVSRARAIMSLCPKQEKWYPENGGCYEILNRESLQCERQLWWNKLSEEDKKEVLSLPNFDSKIFKECTLIDVNFREQKGTI